MSKNYIKIGATLSVSIQRVSNGSPIDLTNYEVSSDILHPKFGRFALETEVSDPVDGQIRAIMEPSQTSRLIPGEYTWDIKFTDPDGNVEVFPKDNSLKLNFIKGATR